jgi:hypothetical protein
MSKTLHVKMRADGINLHATSFEKKIISIQNGQQKKIREIDTLAISFKQAMGRTAAAYLDLAKLAYDASERFADDKWAYDYFCEKIGLSKSYLRKLSQIGSKADLLIKNISFLPNSMNSLYELSQLTEKDFRQVLQKNDISTLTSAEISKLNPKKQNKPKVFNLEDQRKESKTKAIHEFAKLFLLNHQYQIEKVEIRFDPKNSLIPAKIPKIIVLKNSRNRKK